MTKEEVATFFQVSADDLKGAIIYKKTTNGKVYFVDFSLDSLYEKQLCDLSRIESPLISAQGDMVTFGIAKNLKEGTIYICSLSEMTTPVVLAKGFDPHWWYDSQGNVHIVYCTNTGGMEWGNPGFTIRQQINPQTMEAEGAPDTLVSHSLNGGLSKNGRYLSTAYKSTGIYDLTDKQWKSLISGTQACNASISPSPDESKQPQMMHLTLGGVIQGVNYKQHEAIIIRDTTTINPDDNIQKIITLVPSITEWQKPEWSTNYNYAVAVGKYEQFWHIYLIDLNRDKIKKLVADANVTFDVFPHLWIPDTQ